MKEFRFPTLNLQTIVCMAAALALLSPIASAKRIRIVLDASASDEYLEATKDLDYQTYHFYKGAYYGGDIRDPALERTTFEDITLSLAENLKRRDFYPEPNKELGDLLIMVSWGRTRVDPDYQELMDITGQDSGSFESGEEGFQQQFDSGVPQSVSSDNVPTITGGSYRQRKNAALLGFTKNLQKEHYTQVARSDLWEAINDDRYFIVLNAFDYQLLRQTGELRQVWTARYSTQAAGVSFTDAYESLNRAVATAVGHNLDELQKVRVDTKSKAVIGEVEVLSMIEESESKRASSTK